MSFEPQGGCDTIGVSCRVDTRTPLLPLIVPPQLFCKHFLPLISSSRYEMYTELFTVLVKYNFTYVCGVCTSWRFSLVYLRKILCLVFVRILIRSWLFCQDECLFIFSKCFRAWLYCIGLKCLNNLNR